MSIINFHSCSPDQAVELIVRIASMPATIRPSVILHGEPGSGKSAIPKAVAKRLKYKNLIDKRLAYFQACDLMGIPDLDRVAGVTRWLKPAFFPRDPDELGILFFDELTQGARDVLGATYQIFLDRMIDDLPIPDGYLIIAACNDVGDGAIANELGTALNDRVLHINVIQTPQIFIAHHEKIGTHPAVLALVQQQPQILLGGNKERIEKDLTAAVTARSLESCSDLIKHLVGDAIPTEDDKILLQIALSGRIGQEAAAHLILTLEDIHECANPRQVMDAPFNKIPDLLPRTARAGVALAFALNTLAETPAQLVKACAIMQLLALHRPASEIRQSVEGIPMQGPEIAALGIDKLLLKAESRNWTMEVLEGDHPGANYLRDYIDIVSKRQQDASYHQAAA